ncbi:uncharacterized protein F4822DRAFT_418342 [Hypoxylon trugodes]|uniref:uncharacterized protein n=1 Tax=Hypoxylon trugodes TaxID=326681 RepID=UPI002196A9A9|nr:uncharacterized protein F4822DRAFT_418342 [Hypoxylon trugodes]KAI1384008.1 hypothetical protein F4822DRAFT_418342 [Hypoxylon trugodes]
MSRLPISLNLLYCPGLTLNTGRVLGTRYEIHPWKLIATLDLYQLIPIQLIISATLVSTVYLNLNDYAMPTHTSNLLSLSTNP